MSTAVSNNSSSGRTRPNTFSSAITTPTTSSKSSDRTVVKFLGRSAIISPDNPSYISTINSLQTYTRTKINNEQKWKEFHQIVSDFLEHLDNNTTNQQSHLRQYQIDLIQDVILSYLNSLNGRFHTDPSRVRQMTEIMTTILVARNDDAHPAYCLITLERILKDVNSGSYFFPSQLSAHLQNGINRQWSPIIQDNRHLLTSTGGKLLFFGLLGVIGWPIVLLMPLLTHSQRLLQILNDFDHSKRLSPQAIFDLAKIFIMLLVCFQLTSIMAAYATFGYTAAGLGFMAIAIAQNDRLVKDFSPMIAQYAPAIDKVNEFLESGDIRKIGQLLNSTKRQAENFPQSDQVEELPSEKDLPTPSAPIIEEVEDEDVDPVQQIPTNTGLRQRKKDD